MCRSPMTSIRKVMAAVGCEGFGHERGAAGGELSAAWFLVGRRDRGSMEWGSSYRMLCAGWGIGRAFVVRDVRRVGAGGLKLW